MQRHDISVTFMNDVRIATRVIFDSDSVPILLYTRGDSWVGKSSASHARYLGSNPGKSLTRVTPMHEWEVKSLPAVKVILH